MQTSRNWTAVGFGLEVLAGVLVTINPLLAIPGAFGGCAAIAWGLWPDQIRRVLHWRLEKSSSTEFDRKPITTLREWAIASGWNGDIKSVSCEGSDFWTLTKKIEQAAVDKKIKFWGRKYPYDIPEDIKESMKLVPIPADHFEEYDLDVIEFAQNRNYDIFTGKSAVQRGNLRDKIYRDLHVDGNQARRWVDTEGVPAEKPVIRIALNKSVSRIGDFEPICSITVQNISDNMLSDCMVYLEQITGHLPPEMPKPLALRTEGQINRKERGPFKLRPGSPGQQKTIPILFRDLKRKNEWRVFDESARQYVLPMREIQMVLGIHCEKGTDKIWIRGFVTDDFYLHPSLKLVPNDYTLKGSA